jgi:hypothetical protein
VIEVGVREDHFIDAADAALPEKRREVPARHLGTGERTGVVEQGASIRCFNHGAAAVADGEERAAQLVTRQPRGAGGQAGAQPTEAGDAGPAPAVP